MNVTGRIKALGLLQSRYVDFMNHSQLTIHWTLKGSVNQSSDRRSATIHQSQLAMQSLKTSPSGKVRKYRKKCVGKDGYEGVKCFFHDIFCRPEV